jgi:starch synthase (maltosyl-transferring)
MSESSLPSSWSRVVITTIEPEIDDGRWPVKRVVGEEVEVTAGIITDGHDEVAAELIYRADGEEEKVDRMTFRSNDEYIGAFNVDSLGWHHYCVRAWVDEFATWYHQFEQRVKGDEGPYELKSELLEGASLLKKAVPQADDRDRRRIEDYIDAFEDGDIEAGLETDVLRLAQTYEPRPRAVTSDWLEVWVDRERARFSTWYEMFPRSTANKPGKHASFEDAADRLPRIQELGFDIVYLPPIHPIGHTNRKGKDNAPVADENDPGSPWAIGSADGGHKSVHPKLGGMEAFDRFVERARELNLEVAIDIAFQTSPDHPYVEIHPEWFGHRPDGTIRFAENPPKKYQDVYPLKFDNPDWPALWKELKSVFEFWIDHGVTIFRVDNPHTKPYAFWEWCIDELRKDHPEIILLSEAFSRPKVMNTLAKLGFNQSYTYFTWRNTKHELQQYCEQLFDTEVAEYFRPNFWPNTPDILHEYLVHGGRPAHIIRLILAATLSSNYGIYGPPYEHVDNTQHPDREEYANNEKYEIRTWNWNDPNSLQPIIERINRIRKNHPALQQMRNLRFHAIDNPQMLAYTKSGGDNLILVIINLNPYQPQAGTVELPLEELEIPDNRPYHVHDLFGGEWYYWEGPQNYVRLDPDVVPAHVFHIRREVTREQDFPYFA